MSYSVYHPRTLFLFSITQFCKTLISVALVWTFSLPFLMRNPCHFLLPFWSPMSLVWEETEIGSMGAFGKGCFQLHLSFVPSSELTRAFTALRRDLYTWGEHKCLPGPWSKRTLRNTTHDWVMAWKVQNFYQFCQHPDTLVTKWNAVFNLRTFNEGDFYDQYNIK